VITDSVDNLCQKLSRLVELREQDEVAKKIISGFHIEGPFINGEVGYVGAHPPDCVKPANVEDCKRLLEATAGLTKLMTLAPESDEDMATTRFLVDQGITVSAGHCDPSFDQLKAGIDAGLSMVTHVGNGCPVILPRLGNFTQRVLSLSDDLGCCCIPDGAHVDFFALGNYLKAAGIERSIMVTDAIAAAKLGPGLYQLSGMDIEVDEQGVARKPGSPNLAGSTITMPGVRENLSQHLGLNEDQIKMLIDTNPRKAIGI
jgi:N-acetylglucosamine-6-phosphate deacetylase